MVHCGQGLLLSEMLENLTIICSWQKNWHQNKEMSLWAKVYSNFNCHLWETMLRNVFSLCEEVTLKFLWPFSSEY